MLIFDRPAPASTELVFGDEGQPRLDIIVAGALPALRVTISFIPPVQVDVAGNMPAMTAAVRVVPHVFLQVDGKFADLTVSADIAYHTNTQRPTVAHVHTMAQVAAPFNNGVSHNEMQALSNVTGAQAKYQDAAKTCAGNDGRFTNAVAANTHSVGAFKDGQAVADTLGSSMQDADKHWLQFFSQFQEADRLAAARLTEGFEDGLSDTQRFVSKFQEARKLDEIGTTILSQNGLLWPVYMTHRFQDAIVPPIGETQWPKPPIKPDPNWGTLLLFQCPPGSSALVFGALPCYAASTTTVVPIRRVYIVINDASLRRVDGNISIPTLSMSMSLDVDSWTWSASAALPGRALDAVQPNVNGDPVEVEAMFNGVTYRFLVESISRDRSFNQSAIRVGMRGKTALLDAPYAPIMSFGNVDERTMAQLAGDVLTINGVPLDWTVNWTPDAWSVPAGVFQHQGTYISALNELVGAAGAYILPHRTLQEMTVLPRYPTAPWEWASATPDYELPSAVTLQEGIEWVNRPQYNRVFVSGTGQGVLGQVTRTGTAGDLVAPMITNALITDVVGARLRGLPVLADTGRVANVSLKLPVLPETGIIVPGKMVRYTDGADTRIGITRSVSVSVGGSAVDLRQTIAVETHE